MVGGQESAGDQPAAQVGEVLGPASVAVMPGQAPRAGSCIE
jgi:hypothetical protein